MSNYISGAVQSNFGDKKVVIGNLVMDDGAATAWVTGLDQIDFACVNAITAGTYQPRWTASGGSLTIVTAASGTSFNVLVVGR